MVNIDNYKKIKTSLDERNVTLVAVSKTKSADEIKALYDIGQRDFGENYVQELVDKYEVLPKDIRWHFIGHLQTNKVKYIGSFVHLIHGVDSEKLLMEINKQGAKSNKLIPCLLQVYISKEDTKFGFDEPELESLVNKILDNPVTFDNVSIKGLMGMATFTDDRDLIRSEYKGLRRQFQHIQERLTVTGNPFSTLSMGMSADYLIALETGSTMVRIGSLLFGERNQKT